MKKTSSRPTEDEWPPPPRRNPELAGQGEAEKTLYDAFASGRLPHAWLICGPRGVGKATLAYRFARFVLANGGGAATPPMSTGLFGDALPQPASDSLYIAPEHPVFHRIAAAGHADFLSVERSLNDEGKLRSEIVIDDVRGIGAFLSLTAAEGGWRVVLIDCADDMNRNAANAVLKVLEEPPAKALLLLISHRPGCLLPTIRSRCRRLVMKTLDERITAELAAKYSPDTSAADCIELARLSEGSIGRALALAGEGGLELYRDLLGLLKTLPDLDMIALHKLSDRFGKSGADDAFRTMSDLLCWWIGRLILSASGGIAGATGDERTLMERLMKAGGLDRWLEVWEKINHLLARTEEAYLDRKQVMLNVFLALEAAVRP